MAAVVTGGEKGGTGKTTTNINLAVMLALMKKSVIVIDTNKSQASSAKFFKNRQEKGLNPHIPCVQIQGKHLNYEIDELAKHYKYVLVDCGGYDSPELRSALMAKATKKLFSPFKPTSLDIETIIAVDELVEHAKIYNEILEAYSLLNMVYTNPKIPLPADSVSTLQLTKHLFYSGIKLYDRIVHPYAHGFSLSVVEYERQKMNEMPPYQAKSYIPKASIEICEYFKKVFDMPFDYKSVFGVNLPELEQVNIEQEVAL